MAAYAGIGARNTPSEILEIMKLSAKTLASKYTCNTGAAKGADQAFAEGALQGGGQVQLFLPWPSYENTWRNSIHGRVDTHVLQYHDKEAFDSVYNFHPAAANLKQTVIKLHARNFCILRGTSFVICWTPNGNIVGGTGQALRIAQHLGIKIYNLGNPETLTAFKQRLGI